LFWRSLDLCSDHRLHVDHRWLCRSWLGGLGWRRSRLGGAWNGRKRPREAGSMLERDGVKEEKYRRPLPIDLRRFRQRYPPLSDLLDLVSDMHGCILTGPAFEKILLAGTLLQLLDLQPVPVPARRRTKTTRWPLDLGLQLARNNSISLLGREDVSAGAVAWSRNCRQTKRENIRMWCVPILSAISQDLTGPRQRRALQRGTPPNRSDGEP